MIFSYKSIKQI